MPLARECAYTSSTNVERLGPIARLTLDELKQTRHKLQASEAAAAQAVKRAQKDVDDELFRVHECELRLEDARDRAAYERASAALASAKVDHVLAAKRLTVAQGVQAHAELEARTAEAQVENAVDDMFREEDIAAAREVSHRLNEAIRLGTGLLHLAVAMELNGRGPQPPEVTEVLARLDLPVIDRRDIAVNFMKHGDTAAAAKRADRRAALILDREVPQQAA
jgi:hypothetical protein